MLVHIRLAPPLAPYQGPCKNDLVERILLCRQQSFYYRRRSGAVTYEVAGPVEFCTDYIEEIKEALAVLLKTVYVPAIAVA